MLGRVSPSEGRVDLVKQGVMPQFKRLARLGGGTAATLSAERQLMKTLALLIFDDRFHDELAPFLANLNREAVMRTIYIGLLATALLGATASKVSACALPEASLTVPPSKLLHQLETAPAPLLAAADKFSVAMEARYDSPLARCNWPQWSNRPMVLPPIWRLCARLPKRGCGPMSWNLKRYYPELWGDIESLRVAGAYGAAWGRLAAAVRHISPMKSANPCAKRWPPCAA